MGDEIYKQIQCSQCSEQRKRQGSRPPKKQHESSYAEEAVTLAAIPVQDDGDSRKYVPACSGRTRSKA